MLHAVLLDETKITELLRSLRIVNKLRDSTAERNGAALKHSTRSRSGAHLDAYPKDNGVLSLGVNRPRYESGVLLPTSARVVSGAARSSWLPPSSVCN